MPLANLLQCSKKQNSMRKACWNALHRSHRAASNRRVSDRLYSNRWSLIDSLRGIKYKLNLFHWNKWPRKNFVNGVFVKYTRFSILSAFTFVRSRHFFSMQSWHVSYLQSRCPMVSVQPNPIPLLWVARSLGLDPSKSSPFARAWPEFFCVLVSLFSQVLLPIFK